MANTEKSAVKIIFGSMTFGHEGTEQGRVYNLPDCSAILDIFQAYGHNEIDTARFYAEGTSEQILGDLEWQKRGILMDTKFYPSGKFNAEKLQAPEEGWHLTPEGLRANLMISLKALKTETIEMWYLHGPDRTVPLEATMRGVNELFKEGYFKRFGISNFMAWEVAKMCEICKTNGYVMPSVYQGIYNALHRSVEPELFPCLRHYGLAFYNFNPLAGGYLTSRYHRDMKDESVEGRFNPSGMQGKSYRARYWNDAYFDALDLLRPVAKKHGLTEVACALRWMTHHSLLKREFGDGIIIGASSTQQMEENMKLLDDPEPLPQEVLDALDAGWQKVKPISSKYWH
jgi:aflatoxin B1 aldehyde reductase